jgi:tetratricopeptide (TPR) repeat protein
MVKMTSSSKKYTYFTIFILFLLLGTGLRFITLEELSETIYYTSLLPDEQYYHDWALSLLKGEKATQLFEYAPLPAYVMAMVYKVFSVDINLIRVLNIVLNMSGCLLIYLITRRLCGGWWALLSFGMAIFSRELIFYSVVPLKTSLAFFLFAFVVYLVLCICHKSSRKLLLILGIVLGLAMNVRPNILILLPVIFCVIFFLVPHSRKTVTLFSTPSRGYQTESLLTSRLIGGGDRGSRMREKLMYSIFFLFGFLLTALPPATHNYLMTKQFSLIPVQSGFLFYCANTINNPTSRYQPVSFASSHPKEQGIHFIIEASLREGRTLNAMEASRYWQRQVVEEAMGAPVQYLKKVWLKGLMLFNFAENGDHYDIGFMEKFVPILSYFQLQYWMFMVLGYAGIVVGCFRSKEIGILACLLGAYLVTLFLYSTGNRFTLPLLALLIPAGIWYSQFLITLLMEKKWRGLGLSSLVFVIFSFVGFLDLPYSKDLSNHYNSLAYFYNQKGDAERAVEYWQKSADSHQTYSDVALLFLTGHNYHLNGIAGALETLNRIPDTSFMAAAKYATLGDLHKHHGQFTQALGAYEKSLGINGAQRRVREEIINLMSKVKPERAEKERKQLQWVNSFY